MENQTPFDEGIRVAKSALLERVKANRDTHRENYEEAYDAFTKRLIEWFNEQRDLAVAGKRFATAFTDVTPEDRTRDYDAVLDMLDLSLDDEIVLTRQEFRQYVRDEWSWSVSNKLGFSTYTGKEY